MSLQRSREKWLDRLFRVANSTVCFALAYIIITFAFWLVMGLAGLLIKYDSFVYYYGIKYIINDRDWTTLKVTFIFSSGPMFCLTAGLISWFLFSRLKQFPWLLNVFFLWVFIIGTTIFCSQAIIAAMGVHKYTSPYYQNLAVVYSWWHLPKVLVYALALPLLALFFYFAVNYVKPFLIIAFSYSKVNTESRRKRFFIETAVLPYIIGAMITTVVTYPMNKEAHIVYMGMLGLAMVIGWFSLIYIRVTKEDMLRYATLQALNPAFLFLLLIVCYAVFIGWKGINLHVK